MKFIALFLLFINLPHVVAAKEILYAANGWEVMFLKAEGDKGASCSVNKNGTDGNSAVDLVFKNGKHGQTGSLIIQTGSFKLAEELIMDGYVFLKFDDQNMDPIPATLVTQFAMVSFNNMSQEMQMAVQTGLIKGNKLQVVGDSNNGNSYTLSYDLKGSTQAFAEVVKCRDKYLAN